MKEKQSIRTICRKNMKRFIFCLFSAYVFLIGIFARYNYANINEVNNNIINDLSTNLKNDMEEAEQYLLNIFVSNNDFDILTKEKDILTIYLKENNLVRLMEYKLSNANEKNLYFVYKKTPNGYYSVGSSYYSFDQKKEIDKVTKKHLESIDPFASRNWEVFVNGQNAYFIVLFAKGDACMGAVIDLGYYAQTAEGDSGKVVFAYRDNILNNQLYPEGSAKQIRTDIFNFATHRKIGDTELDMYYIIPQTRLKQLIMLVLTITACLIITVGILVRWIWRLFDKVILYPIEQMGKAEKMLAETGRISEELVDSDIEEYSSINKGMVSMIQQVETLKEQVYKKEKEYQEARLQYYQLQTEPHFFLNCLKNVYALAETGQNEKIQYLIKRISNHFRYIFKGNYDDVLLSDEINEAEQYFYLCQMSMSIPMFLEKKINEKFLKQKVPILVIQTFVENSIKYASSKDRVLKITISVEEDENNWLCITIQDNGSGYPEEIIKSQYRKMAVGGEHIGIRNIADRIRIVYDNKAQIQLYNNEEGGAGTRIMVPIQHECIDS